MRFKPATAKLTIGSIDDSGLTVKAQYNPAQLAVSLPVGWGPPSGANKTGEAQGAAGAGGDEMTMEFQGAKPRTMTVEFLFDGYEGAASGRAVDVVAMVGKLEKLASVIDPKSTDENKRRPHHCTISWGDRGLPRFDCVIKKLDTNYTMFSSDGLPLRATCKVELEEAKAVSKKGK